jgi:pyroglutamyl-peptidase
MRRPRLLVTGFGPFPGMARNPSAEIARRIAAAPRWRRLGVAAEALILPTTYAALADVLEPALAKAPDAVLMIGVAGRSRAVRIERQARNRASLLLPDAAGRRPQRLALADGPAARRLGTSPARLRALLRRHGIACRVSHDAGRYICNAAYYRALAGPVPVLFVHIPKPPRAGRRRLHAPRRRSWTDALAAALIEAAALTLRSGASPPSVAGLRRAD